MDDNILSAARAMTAMVSRNGAMPSIQPLAGDASTRRYFRLRFADGDSAILMIAPDDLSVRNFASMTTLMKKLGADTPIIYAAAGPHMLLEDCGDTLLQDAVKDMDDVAILATYKRVLYDLVHFQIAAEAYPEKSAQCFALFFDVEKLTWETDFTWRNFIEGYLHLSPPAGLKDELDAMWIKITGELAANMEALAHRDFHSRNIMVTGGRLVWIDYQDARMGRRLYDLASLLYDPYVALSPVAIDDLAEYYFSRVDGAGAATWNRDEFDRLLNLSALQRIYKALGTYGYQTSARGVDTYVPYIAPSIATLRRIASKTNDTAPLVSLLELIRP